MELLSQLNDKQQQAVKNTSGPLLILAGAGSGKTRTIIYRIAYILTTTDIKPYQILALTFTNKAAGEMKERIAAFGIEYIDEMWMGTFHSICARILRIHARTIGFEQSFTIYDEGDSKNLLKQCLEELNIDTRALSLNAIRSSISRAKNDAVLPKDFLNSYANDFRAEKTSEVYSLYMKKLKENNAMDFDDLLLNTLILLKQDAEVLSYYQNRFVHVLVDEYQDTNRLQYEIISLIAKKYKNICVCGDDDQSIYGFRGADIRNILEFEQDFPNAVVVKLEQNYRSTSNILNTANKLIENNKSRMGKKLWTDKKGGEAIHIIENYRDLDEGEHIAEEIKKIHQNENYPYNKIVILYRTNAQSRVIEESMIRSGIPYQIVKGTRFYERAEVKDIMAYLRCAVNPFDSISFARAVSVPRRKIGQSTIDKITEYAAFKNSDIISCLENASTIPTLKKSAAQSLEEFYSVISSINTAEKNEGLEQAVKCAVEESSYIDFLKKNDIESFDNRRQNINELINAAADFEANSEDTSLRAFLENAALIAGSDSIDDESGQVLLMSIHNSKGLEFGCVFISGVEEGLFPTPQACENETDLEEERRLCYVAITRAMEKLYLSFAVIRRAYGQTRETRPSRFLYELPMELTDARDTIFDNYKQKKNEYFNDDFVAAPYPKASFQSFYAKKADTDKKVANASTLRFASLKAGDRIKHPKWGIGTVIEINDSMQDSIISVAFAGLGIKKMIEGYADITKVE